MSISGTPLGTPFKISGTPLLKSEYVCNDVSAFIMSKYAKKDYSLNTLDQSFLDDFEYYLKTVKNQADYHKQGDTKVQEAY